MFNKNLITENSLKRSKIFRTLESSLVLALQMCVATVSLKVPEETNHQNHFAICDFLQKI